MKRLLQMESIHRFLVRQKGLVVIAIGTAFLGIINAGEVNVTSAIAGIAAAATWDDAETLPG